MNPEGCGDRPRALLPWRTEIESVCPALPARQTQTILQNPEMPRLHPLIPLNAPFCTKIASFARAVQGLLAWFEYRFRPRCLKSHSCADQPALRWAPIRGLGSQAGIQIALRAVFSGTD
jgi:hypothetical protein